MHETNGCAARRKLSVHIAESAIRYTGHRCNICLQARGGDDHKQPERSSADTSNDDKAEPAGCRFKATQQTCTCCITAWLLQEGRTARTTGSCNLEKCKTGVGFRPVMPWLYAPLAILSSATSTNMSTCMMCVIHKCKVANLILRAQRHTFCLFSLLKRLKNRFPSRPQPHILNFSQPRCGIIML
jgi:hypothetical protein